MRRRVLGFAAAALLAIVGTILLVSYVQSAEDRALEGEEIVDVYVVQDRIQQGTDAGDLGDRVSLEKVQAKVAVQNAVVDLDDIEGLVAEVTLLPGEQLTRNRFVEPAQIGAIDIPDGLVEVTIALTPDRAMVLDDSDIGRQVSVISTLDQFDFDTLPLEEELLEALGVEDVPIIELTATPNDDPATPEDESEDQVEFLLRKLEDHFYLGTETPFATSTIAQNVLVTRVTFEQLPEQVSSEDDESAADVELASTGNLLVTLAVAPGDAERVVFSAELGGLWLALEPDEGFEPDVGIEVRDRSNIFNVEVPEDDQE